MSYTQAVPIVLSGSQEICRLIKLRTVVAKKIVGHLNCIKRNIATHNAYPYYYQI